MKNLILLLKSFRLLNVFSMLLLMVGLRFYFWKNVISLNQEWRFTTSSSEFVFLLIIIFIVSIAGYLINDFFDIKADSLNKPNKKIPYSNKILFIIYSILTILSLVLTYLFIDNTLSQYIIYFTVIFLFLYSYIFQKTLLIGNLIVAILSASLPLLFYFFSPILNVYHYWYSDDKTLFYIITFYMVIGFFITLFRELIKDVEDIEGDKIANYKTFPVVIGIKGSKILFSFYLFLFLTALLFSEITIFNYFISLNWICYIPTLILFIFSIVKVYQSNFSKASLFLKLTLFSGVLVLFIL